MAMLLLAASCTVLTGPCTRSITVETQCEPGGSVITIPDVK